MLKDKELENEILRLRTLSDTTTKPTQNLLSTQNLRSTLPLSGNYLL
jgi:hypothetical protein